MNRALTHWSGNWPVLAGYAVIVVVHLAGLWRIRADSPAERPAGWPELRREAAVFHLGLALVLLALVSPLAWWSGVYLWVRAVQDLILAFIGPGLIVLGAPWPALARCLRSRAPAHPAAARPPAGRWLLARPVAVVLAFNLIWLGWHLPAGFDRVVTSGAIAAAEHACYLAVGLLLWLQLIGSRPLSPLATPLRRVGLLTATVVAGTVLGMVLVFGSSVLYPVYGGPAHHIMTVLDDQQLSGAVLWMGMLPPLITAAVALLMRWLSDEESAELSADLDRLLAKPGPAWRSSAWRSSASRGSAWHGPSRPEVR
jgi:putative membrane protein